MRGHDDIVIGCGIQKCQRLRKISDFYTELMRSEHVCTSAQGRIKIHRSPARASAAGSGSVRSFTSVVKVLVPYLGTNVNHQQ